MRVSVVFRGPASRVEIPGSFFVRKRTLSEEVRREGPGVKERTLVEGSLSCRVSEGYRGVNRNMEERDLGGLHFKAVFSART